MGGEWDSGLLRGKIRSRRFDVPSGVLKSGVDWVERKSMYSWRGGSPRDFN